MAFGIDDAITGVSSLLNNAIDKIWPNPEDKAKAEAQTMIAAADAQVTLLKQQMSIALAEAQSGDKWTSRARPSFLYVMYLMILFGIPMGFLAAFNPELAKNVEAGLQGWLAAIPSDLWSVFGWSFGAYALARSGDKAGGLLSFVRGKK